MSENGLTFHELWQEFMPGFQEQVERFSKTTLVFHLMNEAFASGLVMRTSMNAKDGVAEEIQRVLKRLRENAGTAKMAARSRRLQSMNRKIDRILLQGADCTTCDWWRARGAKKKGTRIPGGTGKCTRSEGHCRPSQVRK